MKMLLILLSLYHFNSSAVFAEDPFKKELKSCNEIQCEDLQGIKSMNCKKAKGRCFKKVFHKRIELWKIKGISFKERKSVLKSLSASEKKNKNLIKNLEGELIELKEMLSELKRLQKEIKSLKGPTK